MMMVYRIIPFFLVVLVGCDNDTTDSARQTRSAQSFEEFIEEQQAREYPEFEQLTKRAREEASGGNWRQAADTIEEIAHLPPKDVTTYSSLTFSLCQEIGSDFADADGHYECVSRAILLLLDALETHNDDPHLFVELGTIFRRYIGGSWRDDFLESHIAEDIELLGRLSPLIRINECRGSSGAVHSDLVARELFSKACDRLEQGGVPPDWPPGRVAIVYLYRAQSQASYAEDLASDGRFGQEYIDAWNEVIHLVNDHSEKVATGVLTHPPKSNRSGNVIRGWPDEDAVHEGCDLWRELAVAECSEVVIEARKLLFQLRPTIHAALEEDQSSSNKSIIAELDTLEAAWTQVAEQEPAMSEIATEMLEGIVRIRRQLVTDE